MPNLQAISARFDDSRNQLTLSHPARKDITFDPDDPGQALDFIQWVMPISQGGGLLPARLVKAPGRAMTDSDFPSISIGNLASHGEVETRLGREISPLRWRANILVEGWAPWAERELIGKTIRIGGAELAIRENILRCAATKASTRTGERDADTLTTLRTLLGEQDFGVYAEVTQGGDIATGDTVEVL